MWLLKVKAAAYFAAIPATVAAAAAAAGCAGALQPKRRVLNPGDCCRCGASPADRTGSRKQPARRLQTLRSWRSTGGSTWRAAWLSGHGGALPLVRI